MKNTAWMAPSGIRYHMAMIQKIFAVQLNRKKRLSEVFKYIIPVEIKKGWICPCDIVAFEYTDTE